MPKVGNPYHTRIPYPASACMSAAKTRQRILVYFVPMLLLIVAVGQSYLVETQNLTQWEGGGFGMFSTVDKRQARFVRCYLLTPAGEVLVKTPAYADEYLLMLQAMPTQARAARLAESLADQSWVAISFNSPWPAPATGVQVDSTGMQVPLYRYRHPGEPEPSPAETVRVEAVRVEVLRYRFDTHDPKLTTETIVSATARR